MLTHTILLLSGRALKKIGQGTCRARQTAQAPHGSVYVAINNRTGGLFAIKSVWLGRRILRTHA